MTERPYDVAVIGAGVVGAAVAWRLSHDRLRVLWLEGAHDVAEGASKANSAIACSGFDTEPGTLETELIRQSSPHWEQLCAELDVPFRRVGALVVAVTEEEETRLEEVAARSEANGVPCEVVSGDEVRRMVPVATPAARCALHVPGEGIIDPLRLTLGFAQSAVLAGVDLRLGSPVIGFRTVAGEISHVVTPGETFAVRAVVNAAGLGAGGVAAAAGDEPFSVWPRKGQFLVIDREIGRTVTKILAPPPSPRTRGVLAVPTTNGSVLLGPTAEDIEDPGDKTTDTATLDGVLAQARRLLPDVRREHVIKTFSGLRPASERTYRVEAAERVSNLVHAAGIRSTGVSSSPAVADRVRRILAERGVAAPPRPAGRRELPRRPRIAELPSAAAADLAARDPAYRVLVCACEHVSAAEIRDALTAPVPARSIDAVRKRTRATGGRCQGAYCAAGVGFMLSVERDLDPGQVPQADPLATWGVAHG